MVKANYININANTIFQTVDYFRRKFGCDLMNKPITVGMAILDISKVLMFPVYLLNSIHSICEKLKYLF